MCTFMICIILTTSLAIVFITTIITIIIIPLTLTIINTMNIATLRCHVEAGLLQQESSQLNVRAWQIPRHRLPTSKLIPANDVLRRQS